MKTSSELRSLTRRIQKASAALTALDCGRRHDGTPQPTGADRVLSEALKDIEEAATIAKQIKEAGR